MASSILIKSKLNPENFMIAQPKGNRDVRLDRKTTQTSPIVLGSWEVIFR
jgi:hypothetical protein